MHFCIVVKTLLGSHFFMLMLMKCKQLEMISNAGLKKEALYHEPEASIGFYLNLLAQSATKEYQTILLHLELITFLKLL